MYLIRLPTGQRTPEPEILCFGNPSRQISPSILWVRGPAVAVLDR